MMLHWPTISRRVFKPFLCFLSPTGEVTRVLTLMKASFLLHPHLVSSVKSVITPLDRPLCKVHFSTYLVLDDGVSFWLSG